MNAENSHSDKCGTCGTPENFPADSKSELRPYGPGGALICYRCAFATPEAEERTGNNFATMLDGAAAASPHGAAVIGAGHERGPDPL